MTDIDREIAEIRAQREQLWARFREIEKRIDNPPRRTK